MTSRPSICSCGPDDSAGCPVCEPDGAVARVKEFARQRNLGVVRRGGLDGERIGSVHVDANSEMAYLYVADLDAVIRIAEGKA